VVWRQQASFNGSFELDQFKSRLPWSAQIGAVIDFPTVRSRPDPVGNVIAANGDSKERILDALQASH
jgi:hypothetical protein